VRQSDGNSKKRSTPAIFTAVTYLASTDTGEMNRENMAGVDLFFELPSDWRTRDARFTAVDQKGDVIVPVLFESSHGEPQVMVSRPRDVGYYTLLADSTVITEAAVNIDPFESNLNPQTLDQRYLGAANVIETSEGFVANLKEDKQGREIYVLFLLLAVSALVAEAMLGRRA